MVGQLFDDFADRVVLFNIERVRADVFAFKVILSLISQLRVQKSMLFQSWLEFMSQLLVE
jgi:hypothetical protein